jgi:origin recognition complex subunit 1
VVYETSRFSCDNRAGFINGGDNNDLDDEKTVSEEEEEVDEKT